MMKLAPPSPKSKFVVEASHRRQSCPPSSSSPVNSPPRQHKPTSAPFLFSLTRSNPFKITSQDVLQLVLAIDRIRGRGRRKSPREVPDHSQAYPYSPPTSPSGPLSQHSMPGVPAMLMSVLSASRLPAALNHRTEIYRPSRDDNGHRCPSMRREYSNFTSGALHFSINRLLFTFPFIIVDL